MSMTSIDGSAGLRGTRTGVTVSHAPARSELERGRRDAAISHRPHPPLDVCADCRQPAWLRRDRAGARPLRTLVRRVTVCDWRGHRVLRAGPLPRGHARGSARRCARPSSRARFGRPGDGGGQPALRLCADLRRARGRALRGRGGSGAGPDLRPDRARGHHHTGATRPHHGHLPGRVPLRGEHRPASRRPPRRALRAARSLPRLRGGGGGGVDMHSRDEARPGRGGYERASDVGLRRAGPPPHRARGLHAGEPGQLHERGGPHGRALQRHPRAGPRPARPQHGPHRARPRPGQRGGARGHLSLRRARGPLWTQVRHRARHDSCRPVPPALPARLVVRVVPRRLRDVERGLGSGRRRSRRLCRRRGAVGDERGRHERLPHAGRPRLRGGADRARFRRRSCRGGSDPGWHRPAADGHRAPLRPLRSRVASCLARAARRASRLRGYDRWKGGTRDVSRRDEGTRTNLRARAWLGLAVLAVAMALLLFVPAGTAHYWQAWVYLFLFIGASALTTLFLMKRDPALLERRMSAGPTAEKRPAQKIIMLFTSLGFSALLVVPALDHRYGWTTVPPSVVAVGDALVIIGCLFIARVYRENTFTSATVQVVESQRVISTGPYALVRHPMYASAFLYLVGTPLALGSYSGLAPIAAMVPLLIWRLLDEERLLTRQLPGYADYRTRVRHRLVPFVW